MKKKLQSLCIFLSEPKQKAGSYIIWIALHGLLANLQVFYKLPKKKNFFFFFFLKNGVQPIDVKS